MPATYKAQDDKISARTGDTFIVALEGNPTTGYQWELLEDDGKFRLVEKEYAMPSPGVGAATTEHFVIEALEPGSTKLTFKYKRPWETEVLDTKTFELQVKPT